MKTQHTPVALDMEFMALWDQYTSVKAQRDELLEALKDIAEWTERYTAPGHPIATVARAAIAKATR